MTSEEQQQPDDEARMPLWEHLDELRSRLIRSLAAIGVGLSVTYSFSDSIMRFLESPLLDILPEGEKHLYYTGIADKFFVYLNVSALSSIILVSPFLLYQVWGFVSPALYRNERKFVVPFMSFGVLSFLAGLAFAFYVVIPTGYKFLIEFGSPGERAIITLTEYFSMTLKLMIIMGIVFELPILLVLLARFGIVRADVLTQFRRHAFMVIAVVSAMLTPTPDAFTMLLVMGPLYLLYEVGILGVKWLGTSKS